MDNDTFSDVSTFRGYHWRGTDCDELNAKIYPGRKTGNKLLDHDCNGIFGKADTGKTYEDLWCTGSKRFGVAVLGDSAGAHFSIPEKYFNVTLMQKGVYHDFLKRAADELDLPHESAYTAHSQTDYLSHSVYKYVREWNLCNNNDYQNTGVNGARSTNCETNFKALVRDANEDYPLLVFMELIGNDVCSSDMGMTSVPDFRKNLLKLLGQLDARLPAGSLLISFGLADGEILYDNLHDDKHPLNITYATLYDFLNCLKISPCFGWLNSNETYRKQTTQRARELSAVYQ
jgi:acyloxyacyl hydrolase